MEYYERAVIEEFNSAVSTLRSFFYDGLFDVLSRMNSLANDPTINSFVNAIKELSDMKQSGLLPKLANLNEVAESLSHTSNSYEINELTRAINNLNSAMNNGNISILHEFAGSLNPETLNVLNEFIKMLKESQKLEIGGLSSFESTAAQLSNQVYTLGSYIQKLEQDIKEMQQSNTDIRLRNYLDLLKNEELMKSFGLTNEKVAQAIADELNKLGLPVTYLGSVMSDETSTKAKGK